MPNFIDLKNKKFGKLLVVGKGESRKGHTYWICKCECGKTSTVATQNLRQGLTKSCGCFSAKLAAERKTLKIKGHKFGLLTAIKRIPKTESKNVRSKWFCECECGNTSEIETYKLTSGNTKSCGCNQHSKGEKHSNWKGGKQINRGGYVLAYAPEHPYAHNNRYFEHRMIMEKQLGRYLKPNENVHHKNGIRNDNRIENLELWVKVQPAGQRVNDLIQFSLEILRQYAPENLAEN